MIYTVEFWLIVGLVLCMLELFTGVYVTLSFGVAGLVVAGFIKLYPDSATVWYELIFLYSVMGLLLSVTMWYFFGKKDKNKDINDQ